MTQRLTLSYWGSSTLEMGIEVDDNGHATGWQTGGARVGRFARDLTSAERTALRDAASEDLEIRSDGGDASAVAPSGVAEQLVGDGLLVSFDPVTGPPPELAPLVTILTSIRADLVESPVAAVELAVSDEPPAVRLRQVGTEPIGIRATGALGVAVAAYDQHSTMIDNETHHVDVGDLPAEVGSSWELTLLDHLTLTAPSGGWMSVSVSSLDVDAVGDGVLHQADLSWVST